MIPIRGGTHTTTSTGEATLVAIGAPGRCRVTLDLNALQAATSSVAADMYTFRVKRNVLAGGTEREADPPAAQTFVGGLLAELVQDLTAFDVAGTATVTIQREQGTDRAIPWRLLRDREIGEVLGSTGNSSTGFLTDLASTGDDVHNRKHLRLLTGALATQVDKIADYVGATKRVVLTNGFTATPTSGDDFELVDV